MLKIGMVDHHLKNYHSDTFIKLLHGPLADRGMRIMFAWESHPVEDANWCGTNGVELLASPEEVAAAADFVMVMAPDNIDAHADLCNRVLPAGKPTFVDKCLAPNLAQAEAIAAMAAMHKAPLFSSSALRYAAELEPLLQDGPITEAFGRGQGLWGHYGVHVVAPVVRLMGVGARRVADTGSSTSRLVSLDYGDRRASLEVRQDPGGLEAFPWQFGARKGDRYQQTTVRDFGGFYLHLMEAVTEFFSTSHAAMPITEALEVVAIIEAAEQSQQQDGAWVALKSERSEE